MGLCPFCDFRCAILYCSPPRPSELCLSVNDGVLVLVDLGGERLLASLACVSCATVPLPVVAVWKKILLAFIVRYY